MLFKKANSKLSFISLSIYSFLFIQENLKNINYIKYYSLKRNVYLLIFVYLYETFVALILKQNILYKWKIKDYLQHHLTSSFFILLGYNYGPLDYYENMIKYIFFINITEITRILKNFNINKSIVSFNLLLSLYYMSNLIYYELYCSYKYINSKNNKKYKSIVIFPILASLYHIFMVYPGLLKNNYLVLLSIINKYIKK